MRILFIHQNFPGQYLHIVRYLVADSGHDIVFLTEPNANVIPGVRKVVYEVDRPRHDHIHAVARNLAMAAHRAERVAEAAGRLKRLGFTPDIIIGHHGWGELLNICDIYPATPILGYFEYFYRTEGLDTNFDPEFPTDVREFPTVRAMNAVNLLALALGQHGQSPTRFQRDTYPDWAHDQVRILPEGVRLDLCRPNAAGRNAPMQLGWFAINPGDKLVTFVSRNLEPARGFHVMMRALPALLSARPDLKVVMVGGDEVGYGPALAGSTWRAKFESEMAGTYDSSRVLMPGKVPFETYLRLLQRSDAHVYLTYPFVASWSLREALACGCAVVAADVAPVAEFIEPGLNGLLTPALDSARLASTVLSLLESRTLNQRLRKNARSRAERSLDIAETLVGFKTRIFELVG